jgi:sugar O-acyltransferase (sialic acid O-acetyltransferase NeuD family)
MIAGASTKTLCVVLGGGGHCRVVLDSLQRLDGVVAYAVVDANKALWGREVQGVLVRGGDDQLPILRGEGATHFVVGVGGGGEKAPHVTLYELGLQAGYLPQTVIHPDAVCSAWAIIGKGTVVFPSAVVNAGATLGENVIVNTGSIVEHDCVIGDHVHVATGARICGAVKIGRGAFIGAGAVVRQGISIGAGAVVGAGSVVVHDVMPNAEVKGVPAR